MSSSTQSVGSPPVDDEDSEPLVDAELPDGPSDVDDPEVAPGPEVVEPEGSKVVEDEPAELDDPDGSMPVVG